MFALQTLCILCMFILHKYTVEIPHVDLHYKRYKLCTSYTTLKCDAYMISLMHHTECGIINIIISHR